jgi:GNAT superfamily N-acetyltransferase
MTSGAREPRCVITTDRALMDVDAIHAFLSEHAYWCRGIPHATVARAIERSFVVAALDGGDQVGFARAVTDGATFAWVCDVYVLPAHRGRGLARRMLEKMLAHPELQGLRRWVLATRDAHDLYRRLGFAALPSPERWMIVEDPEVYSRKAAPDE